MSQQNQPKPEKGKTPDSTEPEEEPDDEVDEAGEESFPAGDRHPGRAQRRTEFVTTWRLRRPGTRFQSTSSHWLLGLPRRKSLRIDGV